MNSGRDLPFSAADFAALMAEHERLGDDYLRRCYERGIQPPPVCWSRDLITREVVAAICWDDSESEEVRAPIAMLAALVAERVISRIQRN